MGSGILAEDNGLYLLFLVERPGPVVALFFSPPEKVVHRNGTRIQAVERISDLAELKALGQLILRREILLL